MITARTLGGLAYLETIEEMEKELRKTIEDFDRTVLVEALRLVKKTATETGKHSLSHSGDRSFSMVPCRASRARTPFV